jgi:uncharacterized protein with PIN domain
MPGPVNQETKFVADAMLGSLARKLRAFGFDTSYFKEGKDSDLLELASNDRRVILTSDRALAQMANRRGVRALLVVGKTDSQRISSVKTGAVTEGFRLVPGVSRCSVCNGPLVKKARSDVDGEVPPSVQRRHRDFYTCVDCGRFYWRGAHWKKLRWLQKRLTSDSVDSLTE